MYISVGYQSINQFYFRQQGP